jgi:hypothetical protein
MPKKKDMSPFYRRLLADAWNISVMHKHLWIFGFFAALAGFDGVTEVFFRAYARASEAMPVATRLSLVGPLPGIGTLRLIASYSPFPAPTLVVLCVVALLLFAVLVWMTVVSIGALAAGARKISRGGEPTFGDLVKTGAASFWKLLAINLVAKLVMIATLFVIGMNVFALMLDRGGISAFIYFCSFVLFTAIAFVASLTAILGSVSLMAKGGSAQKAITGALEFIREHWLVCLETAILLMLANVVIGAGALVAMMVSAVPFIFLVAVASVFNASTAVFALMILIGALLVTEIALLGSFLTTFEISAWTLLWSDLSERNAAGLLMRWEHSFRKKRATKKS